MNKKEFVIVTIACVDPKIVLEDVFNWQIISTAPKQRDSLLMSQHILKCSTI